MYDEVIIYNPHTCVIAKKDDPNCDFRSYEYANIFSKYITSVLITSDIPRYICDNNRNQCRNSNTRNKLRPYIKPNNFILEVHSFSKIHNHWFDEKRKEPDIVLLETNNRDIVKKIYKTLLPYYDIVILQGDIINDVQREVNEKMSNGVLIELAYELLDTDIKRVTSMKIIVHSVLNSNEAIDVNVYFELYFGQHKLKHYHKASNNNQVIYNLDLTQDDLLDINGKLWALDRTLDSGRYFTLYPWKKPENITDELHVVIQICGPSISWQLNVY